MCFGRAEQWSRVIFLSVRHVILITHQCCVFDIFSRAIAFSRHASAFFQMRHKWPVFQSGERVSLYFWFLFRSAASGCYVWSSNRPDIIKITETAEPCSSSAVSIKKLTHAKIKMKFSCPRSCRLGTLTTVSAGVRLVVDYRDADTAKKMQPEPP